MQASTSSLLSPVDRVEILIVVDNYVDLRLPGDDRVQQPGPLLDGKIPESNPFAEHGLCLLFTVHQRQNKNSVLFDTGRTKLAAPHNLNYLGVDLESIEAVVISHGHLDHTGGLMAILDLLEGPVAVVAHPDGFLFVHHFLMPNGVKIRIARPFDQNDIASLGGELIESKEPLLLAGNTILVTGQVPRITPFEHPQVELEIERNGRLEPDLILDDQGLVMDLEDRGLVVVSGCGHAGIVNTILYAQRITGRNRLCAVLGGFHLCEPDFDPIIDKTVAELKKLSPEVLVPMHCTGWKATTRLAQEFPSAFVRTSVGTKIVLTK